MTTCTLRSIKQHSENSNSLFLLMFENPKQGGFKTRLSDLIYFGETELHIIFSDNYRLSFPLDLPIKELYSDRETDLFLIEHAGIEYSLQFYVKTPFRIGA